MFWLFQWPALLSSLCLSSGFLSPWDTAVLKFGQLITLQICFGLICLFLLHNFNANAFWRRILCNSTGCLPFLFCFCFFFLYNCTTFENYNSYKTENRKMRKSNKEIGPHQTYILLHSKGNHRQNKKANYRLGEKICKGCSWQGLNFQNVRKAVTTQ